MKRICLAILTIICLVVLVLGAVQIRNVSKTTHSQELRILVAYNPKYMQRSGHILNAYASVLEEEGVNFKTIDQHRLLAVDPVSLAKHVPAVVFPDAVCQYMPVGFETWIGKFLKAGGNIAAIYDPAVKDTHDAYLPSTFFQKFSGINHITYTRRSGDAYGLGGLRFKDRAAVKMCQIPYGKLDKDLFLNGYGYGRLQYPFARNETVSGPAVQPAPIVLAEAVVGQKETYPAIVTRSYGKGHVFYVNMPLGHLKANADDLPLRSMLRLFLFEVVQMPHMMNVPFGKGGIVFNWHHDSNADWPYLEEMIQSGYFRPQLKYSMHITAGHSLDQPGDGQGFDACGQGERFVKMLAPFGTIGSHGGLHHNWFAANIESGRFGVDEIKKYIQLNNQCLESITGKKVSEYSAPKGVHPPHLMTEILSGMGVKAYYYTGDSGSAPNRSFFKGKMLSDRLIAFPVMPLTDKASLAELNAVQTPEREIQHWLHHTVNYAIENRTVRLLYSHPYDLYDLPSPKGYQQAFQSFLDYMEQAQRTNRLNVRPMSDFAHFMLQMLKARCRYMVQSDGLEVHIQKPAGLRGLTLEFSVDRYQPPQGNSIQVRTDNNAYYATIESDAHETRFFVPAR